MLTIQPVFEPACVRHCLSEPGRADVVLQIAAHRAAAGEMTMRILLAASLLVLAGCGGSPMSVESRDTSWQSPTSALEKAQAEARRQQRRGGEPGGGF
jgi:hypothetical protein